MNVITITREYGAGGGEVARKLAETLGWELLDRELLHQAAEVEHVPDAELERLDEKAISMADRFRLHPPHQKYLHGLKRAAESAAPRGNVILVGRGARHLLGEQARRAPPAPGGAEAVAGPADGTVGRLVLGRRPWPVCTETDRIRDRFTRYFFGDKARPAGPIRPGLQYAGDGAGGRGGRGRGDASAGPRRLRAAVRRAAGGS